jgi:hypothetical protein
MLRTLLIFTLTIVVASCSSNTALKTPENSSVVDYKKCPEERLQMCTREYMPVCATRDTGVRCITAPCPSSEQKTYSNGCTACADEKVSGYVKDACAESHKVKD